MQVYLWVKNEQNLTNYSSPKSTKAVEDEISPLSTPSKTKSPKPLYVRH